MMQRLVRAASLALAFALSAAAAGAADWPVFGHDPARSGDGGAQGLSAANVTRLHERFRVHLGEVADNAPIVAGKRLYITTRNGTTYAVDTASGGIVWHFATTGPKITTSVPAFDAATNQLFVPGVDGFVHKLDPANGHELRGGGFPVRITTAPETEKNASPLNVAGGYLYAQTSGYIGDATPYVGHIVAVHLSDGAVHVFNTLCSSRYGLIAPESCSSQRSGMWSRAGVVVDPDPAMGGRIYSATGNARFDPGSGDYGDSILELSADATRLLGYATPSDPETLEAQDLDVGSSSPALLPRVPLSHTPLMAVQGGKDSVLRLLDRAHLNGTGPPLQNVPLGDQLFTAPAIWNDRGTIRIYIGLGDGVHAFALSTSAGRSRLVSDWHAPVASPREGSSPVVSDGVVFYAGSGRIVALDGRTGHQLWGHELGPIHWQSPVVADGALYCADGDGNLWAFATK